VSVAKNTLGLAPIVIGHISEAIKNLKKTGFTILIAEQNASFTIDHAERIIHPGERYNNQGRHRRRTGTGRIHQGSILRSVRLPSLI
jgi:ABC-type lipopolysaccharide export system ATPase subunit